MKNKKQGDSNGGDTSAASPAASPAAADEHRLMLTSTPLKSNGFFHGDDDDDGGGILQKAAPKTRQSCGKIGRISFLEPGSPPSPTTKEIRRRRRHFVWPIFHFLRSWRLGSWGGQGHL